jgi:hypothetical protein
MTDETEDINQITADNLRADFLNASTNYERWKVLERALSWAVAASEVANHLRLQTEELKAREEVPQLGRLPGDTVQWGDEEETWIVRHVGEDGLVNIAPLAEDWPFRQQIVPEGELT